MRRRNFNGRKTQVLLRTMSQTKLSLTVFLTDQATAVDITTYRPLLEVKEKWQSLVKWTYLSKINFTPIKSEVHLLTGTNAPQLLETWEVIGSQGNSTYTVKSVLSRVVNGRKSK